MVMLFQIFIGYSSIYSKYCLHAKYYHHSKYLHLTDSNFSKINLHNEFDENLFQINRKFLKLEILAENTFYRFNSFKYKLSSHSQGVIWTIQLNGTCTYFTFSISQYKRWLISLFEVILKSIKKKLGYFILFFDIQNMHDMLVNPSVS